MYFMIIIRYLLQRLRFARRAINCYVIEKITTNDEQAFRFRRQFRAAEDLVNKGITRGISHGCYVRCTRTVGEQSNDTLASNKLINKSVVRNNVIMRSHHRARAAQFARCFNRARARNSNGEIIPRDKSSYAIANADSETNRIFGGFAV